MARNIRSVTPSLVVTPCAAAIEFYIAAFGAEEIEPRMVGPDGSVGQRPHVGAQPTRRGTGRRR